MERSGRISISVVYALPHQQTMVELDVAEGTTVAEAVERSALAKRFAEIASLPPAYAIFGQAVAPGAIVRAGDRIEILRPLLIDPKEGRRQAVARSRAAGKRS